MTDFTGMTVRRDLQAGDHRTNVADITKQYVCYCCEEIIEFALPCKELTALLTDETRQGLQPSWRHVKTGHVACKSMATPSNVEVIL
jgi:hypothetical protein